MVIEAKQEQTKCNSFRHLKGMAAHSILSPLCAKPIVVLHISMNSISIHYPSSKQYTQPRTKMLIKHTIIMQQFQQQDEKHKVGSPLDPHQIILNNPKIGHLTSNPSFQDINHCNNSPKLQIK